MLEPSLAEPQIAGLLKNILAVTRLDLDFSIQQHPGSVPDLTIEFSGPDTPRLIARNAELLKALEHLAAKVRGLDHDQHDLLSCDADRYKLRRDQALQESARQAAFHVEKTGVPYTFPPMSSHERRQLHLILNREGLQTSSTGEGPERRVVLYPAAVAQLTR